MSESAGRPCLSSPEMVRSVARTTSTLRDDRVMTRKPRDQDLSVLHHVMGRGCRGEPIFQTDADRMHFTHLLGTVVEKFEWKIYNWVLMPNHHHLVVELTARNLDEGMKRAQGLFAQRWNERNESTGHVFFRRYKNIPMRRPGYASTVMNYIDLNPVRAGLCNRPEQWEWSGYSAIIGQRSALPFHDATRAVRIVSALYDEPAVNRLEYQRQVSARTHAAFGRGTSADSRPNLDEILERGNPQSLREAQELWSYSLRDIATAVGVCPATVMNWINHEVFPLEVK